MRFMLITQLQRIRHCFAVILLLIGMNPACIFAQALGLNNSSPDASAILDAVSTTKGILIPRMTGAQASTITSPATGLTVYITTTNGTFTSIGYWYYNASAWTKLLDTNAGAATTATNVVGGVAGSIPYQTGSGATSMLSLGAGGEILQAGTSAPAWTAYTAPTSVATGDVWYGSAANVLSTLAGNTTSTKKFLTQTGTGSASAAPAWGTISTSDVTGTVSVGNGGTGLTTFGGTNTVLYTSAANTLTSVAASSGAGQFLQTTTSAGAPSWLTTLGVANGGTGTTTAPTVNGIIYGGSSSAYASTAASATAGQVLATTTSGGVPTWLSLGGVATLGATTAALSGTTEQVVVTASIPANTMNVGTTFRIKASGTCTSTAANVVQFLIRVGNAATPGSGDALALNLNPTSKNSGAGIAFSAEAIITIKVTGAASTASVLGSGVITYAALSSGLNNSASLQNLVIQTTTAATSASFATTNANNIHLNVTTAAATTTLTFYDASIEVIKY